MSTYRYTANLIRQTIKQNFDDSDISIDQICYWIQVSANRLRYLRLQKKNLDTGVYLALIEGVKVQVSGGKKYIELPEEIVDIDEDKGIESMTYCQDNEENCESPLTVQFERTSPSEARALMHLPIRKPSPALPFFYRVGNKLYILGLELVDVGCVELYLHTLVNPSHICDLDTEIPVDESQEEALIARVLTLIRFGLLIDNEKKNDGSDSSFDSKNKTALSEANISEQQPQQQPNSG